MKTQVISGVGGLLMILSGFSVGLSYLDNDAWPPLGDFRWILVALGVLLIVLARVMHGRETASRD